MVRRLILHSFQSPGDVLMLTAAVRDLHLANPGKFQTDIRTSADALWEHNPHVTRLNGEPGVETLECHYPLVHQANSRPYHFIHGYAQFLEQRLGVPIPLTKFAGDVHLSAEEKSRPLPFAELGLKEGFWIVMAGGKYDFTAKWWDPAAYQAVVDHFQGRIQFAQCGEAAHWHPRLKGVVDVVGRTNLRDFVVLMHHAAGVLCPVTFAMHLAAAVPTKAAISLGNGLRAVPQRRPCVVVAGAREPAHWEQYPGHQFLHTLGSLPCCVNDPCWRSRCQLVGDGDEKDRRDVCERPVQLTPELRIAQCMALITPHDVIRAIERYRALECGDSSPLSRVAERLSFAKALDGALSQPIQNPKSEIQNPAAVPRQAKAAMSPNGPTCINRPTAIPCSWAGAAKPSGSVRIRAASRSPPNTACSSRSSTTPPTTFTCWRISKATSPSSMMPLCSSRAVAMPPVTPSRRSATSARRTWAKSSGALPTVRATRPSSRFSIATPPAATTSSG
ncbi:MAG TPA: glycosyltransferase family 9 protein [Pirellulales bacterium]|nr:glycosyltransferase family 9 protein [Pirellulales bacterium]